MSRREAGRREAGKEMGGDQKKLFYFFFIES